MRCTLEGGAFDGEVLEIPGDPVDAIMLNDTSQPPLVWSNQYNRTAGSSVYRFWEHSCEPIGVLVSDK